MATVFVVIDSDGYAIRAFADCPKAEAWLKFEEAEGRLERNEFDILELPFGS